MPFTVWENNKLFLKKIKIFSNLLNDKTTTFI
jgi:hypothetical protein